HIARPAVLEQRVIAVDARLVDRAIGLRRRHGRRRRRGGHRPGHDGFGRNHGATGRGQRQHGREQQAQHNHGHHSCVRRASISSEVFTALLFISYARCVVIMLTSSSATFTFEVSTYCCRIEPAPSMPGCRIFAGPDESVSRYRFSPTLCRPGGLMKVASCNWPICTFRPAAPGWVTDTVPSLPIVSDSALSGTLMGGWIT